MRLPCPADFSTWRAGRFGALVRRPASPGGVVSTQKEIGNVLPAREQYIVTTSEFDTVKTRLRGIENRNKLRDDKTNKDKPTLRTRTERQPQAGGQQPDAKGDNAPSD